MGPSSGKRLGELDALRGLAAFTVILGHFAAAYSADENVIWHGSKRGLLIFGASRVVTSGHQAVLLFFLLSGLVLALPTVNNKPQSYGVFITRRVFRIYVPYLAALALAVLGNLIWHGSLGLNDWADQTWRQPVHWGAVMQHVLFIGQYDPTQFNTAFWTLVVEMRISILFPFICLLVLRARPWIAVLTVVAVSIGATILQRTIGLNAFEQNCHYAGFFVIGILLARYHTPLVERVSHLSNRVAWELMALCLLLYFYGALFAQVIAKVFFKVHSPGLIGFDWISGFGAVMMIVLGLAFLPFSRFLMSMIPQFLGRISYSTYLLHGTVLFALLHLFNHRLPPMVILFIYVPLVLVASTFFYRWVEKPAMDLGRQITTPTRPGLQLRPAH